MSLALNSAQQNLAKVIAGKGPDSEKVFDYLVENFSGAEFTLEDLQKDEDLQLLMSPPKASKAKKSSGRGAKTSEERAREGYDPDRCDARVWLNGFGGQCTHKKDGDDCMCTHHLPSGKWGSGLCDEDGNWWLGLVTGSRPENPVRPGGSGKPKAWKMTEDGEVVEKPVKEKKPKMTDEEKKEKELEKEEKKKEKELEKEEKKKEKELEKEEKELEKEEGGVLSVESEEEMSEIVENNSDTEDMSGGEEESDYLEIIFEGVEYQQHKETGEILDPDDFSEMGFWNAETDTIDWATFGDAEKLHESKKSEL
jgi:hypothetical protein